MVLYLKRFLRIVCKFLVKEGRFEFKSLCVVYLFSCHLNLTNISLTLPTIYVHIHWNLLRFPEIITWSSSINTASTYLL